MKVDWLKDCEICNAGLCHQMDEYKSAGMSDRDAATQVEKDSNGLYSASVIRDRYRYHAKRQGGGKSPKMTDDEILARAEKIKARRVMLETITRAIGLGLFTPGTSCELCLEESPTCEIRKALEQAAQNEMVRTATKKPPAATDGLTTTHKTNEVL